MREKLFEWNSGQKQSTHAQEAKNMCEQNIKRKAQQERPHNGAQLCVYS